ncbi:hypothetical protein CMI37_21970 [Candidatus Pacearchaeota archaeon]|nr:hypothetical protein [Candidatus Pacearchaeota archaeon]|tara:strand:- start:764 stop:1000 length:237 start_codon:yes stop_codon:yes gene_type:complete
MRTFKWSNEDETFQVDDSTGGGKDTCSDLLRNGAVEIKASKKESPTMSWKINDIREYLADNDVDYDRGDSKKELLARL